jgi:hypothetical protein
MGKLLCATRGGRASYRTQDAAIALAKEQGDELLFLFAVTVDFLDWTARAVRPDVVEEEMTKLGEFLLEMACERAKAQDVEAGAVLRHGPLREELKAAVQELEVTTVILGKPDDCGVYSQEEMEALAAEIEAETKTQALVLG